MADLYQSKFYKCWANMKTRCNNRNTKHYYRYGGRGISYDKKWETFGGFFDDMYDEFLSSGAEKNKLQLDRIDNNGDYCKENCKFSTPKEQAINRRHTRLVEYNGEKNTLSDWAIINGIKRSTLAQRFYVYKWNIKKCFNK